MDALAWSKHINVALGDANPANLIPLSPRESAPLYVEMKENPGVRNSFLAAYALRSDIPPGSTAAAEPERSAHR